MPGPNLNQGDAPNDVDDVQDLWYALEQLGFTAGVIGQADEGFLNDESVAAGNEVSITMTAPGGDKVNGQARCSGQYSLSVEWLDVDLNVVRREGIVSNRQGGVWSNYSLEPKSPYVNIVIENDTASEQTADMTAHYR